jgi:hypothetical protein
MLEEPAEDQVALLESIGEKDLRFREDQDELESEEEPRSSVLFTQEQLQVLLKMNRPDFGELVAALKTGAARVKGFYRPSPGTSMVPTTARLWMLGLLRWTTTHMPPRWAGIPPWNLPNPT